jgi:hypothetical protein
MRVVDLLKTTPNIVEVFISKVKSHSRLFLKLKVTPKMNTSQACKKTKFTKMSYLRFLWGFFVLLEM